MRGYEYNFFEIPFEGFGPGFGPRGRGRPSFGCPEFRGDFHGHHGPRHGPFGWHGYDNNPERPGPEHHRHGPLEDHCGPFGRGPPRCDRRESPDRHHSRSPERDYHGPTERHHGPRCGRGPQDFQEGRPRCSSPGPQRHRRGPRCHGPGPYGLHPWRTHSPDRHCFGRRAPPVFPWEGPWGGSDQHRFGWHGPWFGHRKPCPYNRSRNPDCENEPCCSNNKENRGRDKGRKENGPCGERNKDQNPTGDTVFVQRIVLEKATRPQSV